MDTGRGVLNTGVYWGEKGRVSGRGKWGGIALGEILNVDDVVMGAADHHSPWIPMLTNLHILHMYPRT